MKATHGGGSAGIIRETMIGDGGTCCIDDGGSAFIGSGNQEI